jgi:hypothetical protein
VVFTNGTAFLFIKLGGDPGTNDQLAVNGSLTVGSGSTLFISGGAAGNIYTAVTFTANQLIGTFINSTPSSYTVTYDNSNGIITIEPNAAAPANLAVSPTTGFNAAGKQGGPFTPSSQVYTLSNSGGNALTWSANVSNNWLDLSPTNGTLGGGANTNVTGSINGNANPLVAGLYSNVISFVNLTNGQGNTNRVATLLVLTPLQAWQMQYFGCTGCPQAAPTADPDGDGCDNLCEFTAGTDPTNSMSGFRITSIMRTNNDVNVTWMCGAGRTNVLQAAPSVGGAYSNISPNIILQGSGDIITNYLDSGAVTNGPGLFYRTDLVP